MATPAQPTQATAAAAHAVAANIVVAATLLLESVFPHVSGAAATAVAVAVTPILGVLFHWAIVKFGMAQYVEDEAQVDAHPEPVPIAPPSSLPAPPSS